MTYRYIDICVSVHRVIDLFLSISFYIYTVYTYALCIYTQWVYYKELAHVIVRIEKSHSLRSTKLVTQENW